MASLTALFHQQQLCSSALLQSLIAPLLCALVTIYNSPIVMNFRSHFSSLSKLFADHYKPQPRHLLSLVGLTLDGLLIFMLIVRDARKITVQVQAEEREKIAPFVTLRELLLPNMALPEFGVPE